uniref:Hermes trasposase DNA-binding domain-containing protein n=1 Tax=Knipowitschia caucasica TaxID=637954 RepID=A0AAV2K449_KNICA
MYEAPVGGEPVSAEMVDLTEALVDMVIEDSQPFSIVEGTGFRKLVKALAPSCVLPTRQTLKAMVEKRYREAKDKAKVDILQVGLHESNQLLHLIQVFSSHV